ncbi:unnamed protein product [Gulo gulo]|uniref:Uncharacterized protein n=1 Tax=Gulo gulo TaxID=48420 RepID=A0A9X9PVE7_GULGU|nr:unnamed protein product [Gulo gulo]
MAMRGLYIPFAFWIFMENFWAYMRRMKNALDRSIVFLDLMRRQEELRRMEELHNQEVQKRKQLELRQEEERRRREEEMRRQQEEMMRRQQEGFKGTFPDAVYLPCAHDVPGQS